MRAEAPKAEAKVDAKMEAPKMSASQVSNKSAASKPEKIKYSARFIKESIPDMFEVAPGAFFSKTWTMRNDGVTAWPEDVIFIQTNGDNLGAYPVTLEAVVSPQAEYDWTVKLQAPQLEGKYCAYFRMAFGDNIRFGHKVWCNILVKKPAEAKPAEVKPVEVQASELVMPDNKQQKNVFDARYMKENPIDSGDENFEILPDKSGGSIGHLEENKEFGKLSISNVFQTPKEVYFCNVAKEADE